MMDRERHWQQVYRTKAEQDTSWFEPVPSVSLRLLEASGLRVGSCVLDVGAGASRLVEMLAARGLSCLAVLDVSPAALQWARQRMGAAGDVPVWIAADVTGDWTTQPVDIWHDRAAFHFLTDASDRTRYLQHMRETIKLSGTAIIATFALDGPEKCSGLPVARYSPELLSQELGESFALVDWVFHQHVTPSGTVQSLQYSRFIRVR